MLKENVKKKKKKFASGGVYVSNFITKKNFSICKFSSDVSLSVPEESLG